MDFKIPELVDQRYRVGELIGTGAMATVHSAEDTRLGRQVALKILRPEHSSDATFRARFQREAEAVASLNHPFIVAVYDTGTFEVEDGEEQAQIPFMVMELVKGQSLRELLRSDGALPLAEGVAFSSQILEALQYASDAGIVHRDIKPANVMIVPANEEDESLGRPGSVKVMDFGIARALEDSGDALTKANTVMGTARYISPEQARGETVDSRSDIYSAGCLIYEMLTGKSPFDAESNVDLAAKHLSDPVVPPSQVNPDLPQTLDPVLEKALAKSRIDRFQSADEFRAALETAAGGVVAVLSDPDATEEATVAMPISGAAAGAGLAGYSASATGQEPVEDTGLGSFFDSTQDEYSEDELFAYERDEAIARKKRRRTAWIRALTGLVIVLLAATSIGTALYYQNELNKVPTNAIPAVQNMSREEAENTMRNLGFALKFDEEFSDTVAKGNIIKSSPVTGTVLEEGTEVTLTVSKGPAQLAVPENLAGQSEQYVRSALTEAGFVPGRTTSANSSSVPAGMVISVDPAEGERIAAGATVNIVLSNGKVEVPSLVGLTRDQAVAALSAADVLLNTNIETVQTSSSPAGTVISQSAAAGTSIEQGSTITIRVAQAPAATSAPAPSASASRSPSAEPSASASASAEPSDSPEPSASASASSRN